MPLNKCDINGQPEVAMWPPNQKYYDR